MTGTRYLEVRWVKPSSLIVYRRTLGGGVGPLVLLTLTQVISLLFYIRHRVQPAPRPDDIGLVMRDDGTTPVVRPPA